MTFLSDRLGPTALVIELDGNPLNTERTGPVVIRHGRSDPAAQPDASTCTISFYGTATIGRVRVGGELTVDLGPSAAVALGLTGEALTAAAPRFVGRVTDVTVAPGVDGTQGSGVFTVTAVSARARLPRVPVGGPDVYWPPETDGERAERVLLTVMYSPQVIPVGDADPGTVNLHEWAAPPGVPVSNAATVLDEIANQSGGVLATRRAGQIEYHDANHRRGITPLVELTAANVLRTAAWTQQLAGMVNDVTVTYGAPPEDDTPRPSVRVVDSYSTTWHGVIDTVIESEFDDAASATIRATDLIGRRSLPRWRLDALSVDVLRALSTAQAAALAGLEVGELVTVTGFPEPGPYTSTPLYIEGWTETFTAAGWTLDLDVTEYGLTGPAQRWVDVPQSMTWENVPTWPVEVTWFSAVGWYSGTDALGRWIDTPTSTSWAEVPSVKLWNNYS